MGFTDAPTVGKGGTVYLLGEIDGGGFIWITAGASKPMLHKETRGLHHKHVCIETLTDAKQRRTQIPPHAAANPLIIKLTPQGGGERLYAQDKDRDEVTKRLQYWKGCYGAWPVQFLRH